MMLIDKGYYDYDYKYCAPLTDKELPTVRTNDEMASIMSRFGFNTKLGNAQSRSEVSAEEMKEIIKNG